MTAVRLFRGPMSFDGVEQQTEWARYSSTVITDYAWAWGGARPESRSIEEERNVLE